MTHISLLLGPVPEAGITNQSPYSSPLIPDTIAGAFACHKAHQLHISHMSPGVFSKPQLQRVGKEGTRKARSNQEDMDELPSTS